MARLAVAALMITALTAAGAAQSVDKKPSVDFGGKLYRSVFSSGTGVLAAADADKLPDPLKTRLARYLSRRTAFKSSYKSAPEDLRSVRSDAKRRLLERSIVAMIEAPGIEKMAADFVRAAPIAHEWEGLHTGPLAEAAFAETALKADPSSPLTPWLYVFIAERQRIVFESCENEKDEEGMKAAAGKYRAFVDRARAVADPIFPALVSDLDAQPFLYIKNSRHPRDYNPGAL